MTYAPRAGVASGRHAGGQTARVLEQNDRGACGSQATGPLLQALLPAPRSSLPPKHPRLPQDRDPGLTSPRCCGHT